MSTDNHPSIMIVRKWPRPKAVKLRDAINKINMCGCGTDAHWEVVLELLEQSKRQSDRTGYVTGDQGFYVDKWHEFGAKVLDSWGWLEHGTGIGWAWLTDTGKLVREFLLDFGVQNHCFDDSTGHPEWSAEFSWDETPDENDSYSTWVKSLTS